MTDDMLLSDQSSFASHDVNVCDVTDKEALATDYYCY